MSSTLKFISLFLLFFLVLPSKFEETIPASISQPYSRSPSTGYGTVTTYTNGSVVRATINNSPINLYDYKLAADLFSFVSSLMNNTEVKVVILSSANPNFFIAHYDIHYLSVDLPALPPGNLTEINIALLSTRTMLATLPIIFIAEISGRAHGAGNEIAVQCDIRYAGPGTRLSQFEIGFGLLPGAGGLQFLVNLIGRARAFEYVLSGRTVNASTAEAIGWVNKAFASKEELRREVESLAHRIAAFPKDALAAIKARINVTKPTEESLAGDNVAFLALTQSKVAQMAANRYLNLSKNQTASQFELNLTDNLVELMG